MLQVVARLHRVAIAWCLLRATLALALCLAFTVAATMAAVALCRLLLLREVWMLDDAVQWRVHGRENRVSALHEEEQSAELTLHRGRNANGQTQKKVRWWRRATPR